MPSRRRRSRPLRRPPPGKGTGRERGCEGQGARTGLCRWRCRTGSGCAGWFRSAWPAPPCRSWSAGRPAPRRIGTYRPWRRGASGRSPEPCRAWRRGSVRPCWWPTAPADRPLRDVWHPPKPPSRGGRRCWTSRAASRHGCLRLRPADGSTRLGGGARRFAERAQPRGLVAPQGSCLQPGAMLADFAAVDAQRC